MKKAMAMRMRTKKDKEQNIPPFQTKEWKKRKDAIRDRVKRKQGAAHERALMRKALTKTTV